MRSHYRCSHLRRFSNIQFSFSTDESAPCGASEKAGGNELNPVDSGNPANTCDGFELDAERLQSQAEIKQLFTDQ